MLSWSNPLDRTRSTNTVYTQVREHDHFKYLWSLNQDYLARGQTGVGSYQVLAAGEIRLGKEVPGRHRAGLLVGLNFSLYGIRGMPFAY
ncbi:hypothetical protein ACFX1Q_046068 [Malus domestica]